MPIYEYLCLNCSTRFELMRSMKDADAPAACQYCESENISRKLSVFYAQSGGRVVAGGNTGCSSCSTNSCATCGVK